MEQHASQLVIVAVDVIEYLGRQDEEAPVHPASVALGLLLEASDLAVVHREDTPATGRLHGGHRGQRAPGAVRCDELTHVHVGHAVAVGEAKVFVAQVVADALEPPARQRAVASVDQGHAPPLGGVAVRAHRVRREVERDVRRVEEVVREVLLDDVTLVSEAHDEVAHPVVRVDLHDVPEDRLAADLDHGLGPQLRLFADPRSEAARENDCLHRRALDVMCSASARLQGSMPGALAPFTLASPAFLPQTPRPSRALRGDVF